MSVAELILETTLQFLELICDKLIDDNDPDGEKSKVLLSKVLALKELLFKVLAMKELLLSKVLIDNSLKVLKELALKELRLFKVLR
jgi:hypothetical protein